MKYYYSSILYVLNSTTMDSCSLGRMHFDPETGIVKVDKNFSPLATLAASQGLLPFADDYFDGIKFRLETESPWTKERMQHFIDSRANSIHLTELRPTKETT